MLRYSGEADIKIRSKKERNGENRAVIVNFRSSIVPFFFFSPLFLYDGEEKNRVVGEVENDEEANCGNPESRNS